MPEISKEVQSLRNENSKTFDLGNGKRQLVVSIGAIHYRDNYADKSEQWKDIDLTWVGNRITKAPYELTREGSKLTIRDKKSGAISTIELLGDVGRDTDIEIVAEYSRVRFTRILKSDKAPVEAKFKVTGNFIVRAEDAEGELPIESTLKDGILTETLKPNRAIKYPVRIDPTWQVGTDFDDCFRRLTPSAWSLGIVSISAGAFNTTNYQYGGGMRFTNITIEKDTVISEAYLTFRARVSLSLTVVNTRISAEGIDDAPTFADSESAFDTRWANRTTARMDWDGISAWTGGQDYDSPTTDGTTTFASIIQEIVDRGGWNSGQDIVIFWEDFEDRSTHQADDTRRMAESYDGSTEFAPKLVVTYTVGVTHLGAVTFSGVGTLTAIGRGIFIGQATLSGTGTLTGIGSLIAIGKATLSGTGTLVANGVITVIGKATLSGTGSLSAIGSFWRYGKATLSGVGTLTGIGRLIATGKATLSGIGTLTANGVITVIGKATLSGVGTLSAISLMAYARSLTTSIGMSVTLGRLQAHIRSLTTSIGLSATLIRSQGKYRTFTTAIGLVASLTTRYWGRRIVRSVGDNRDISSVGTNRDISTTGDNRNLEDF